MELLFVLFVGLIGFSPFLILALLLYFILHKRKPGEAEEESIQKPHLFPWVLLLAVLGLNFFAYEVDMGIGLGLFFTTLLAALVLSFERSRRSGIVYFTALLGSVAALFLAWRGNDFVQQVNLAIAILSIGGLLLLHALDHFRWSALWVGKMDFLYPFESVRHLPLIWKAGNTARKSGSTAMGSIVKTLLLTLVPLLFFSYLLSAADPVFDQMIKELREQALGRTILSVALAGALTYWLTLKYPRSIQEHAPTLKFLSFTNVIVPTVALLILFAVFLSVQATYLFGSHADFQAFDLTYSEYVRQGFIELLWATFVGAALAYILILKQREMTETGKAAGLQGATALLIIALGLLLLSAWKRDAMYIEMYGLTRVRIIGLIFLGWLGCVLTLLLIFTLWRRMLEKLLLTGILGISALTLLTLNALNIDRMIAEATPPRNQPKDYFYISMLSSDALDGWRESINWAANLYDRIRTESVLSADDRKHLAHAKFALHAFIERRDEILRFFDEEEFKWQEYNSSMKQAYKAFKAESHTFQGLPDCLVLEIEDYQLEQNQDLYKEEYDLDHSYEYPFVRRTSYYPQSLETIGYQQTMTVNSPRDNSIRADACR
jgi:hypothetical protein